MPDAIDNRRNGLDPTARRDAHRTNAKTMRHEPTASEAKLWKLLRAKRPEEFKFRRQYPIGPFIADFACPAARLIIEADGSQHAESQADARRTIWLEAQGWRVLRFWNAEILTSPDDVARIIYLALTSPLPPTAKARRAPPSPARGEG